MQELILREVKLGTGMRGNVRAIAGCLVTGLDCGGA